MEIIVPQVHIVASETASAFLQQMSHPGLKRHKLYPIFLSGETKPGIV